MNRSRRWALVPEGAGGGGEARPRRVQKGLGAPRVLPVPTVTSWDTTSPSPRPRCKGPGLLRPVQPGGGRPYHLLETRPARARGPRGCPAAAAPSHAPQTGAPPTSCHSLYPGRDSPPPPAQAGDQGFFLARRVAPRRILGTVPPPPPTGPGEAEPQVRRSEGATSSGVLRGAALPPTQAV